MRWLAGRLLLLAALLFLSTLGLNWLGERAGSVYKDGAALVCEGKRRALRAGFFAPPPGRAAVLFFGTSRILAGIVPGRFDKLTGPHVHSVNLALPGLPIAAHYLELRDYLARHPPPRFIVMQLYTNRCVRCGLFDYYMAQGVDRWRDLPELLPDRRSRGVLPNALFPFRMYKYMVGEYLHERVTRPRRRLRLEQNNRDTLQRMLDARGYYFINTPAGGAAEMEEGGQAMEFDPFADPFTERFFRLARSRGSRILLIEAPQRPGQYRPYAAMPRQHAMLLSRYDNVRMARNGWQIKTLPAEHFVDQSHLTPRGALLYTRRVAEEFIECFGLPGPPQENR